MIVSVVAEAQEAVCIESGDKDRTVAAIVVAHTVRIAVGIVVDLVAVVRSIAVVRHRWLLPLLLRILWVWVWWLLHCLSSLSI